MGFLRYQQPVDWSVEGPGRLYRQPLDERQNLAVPYLDAADAGRFDSPQAGRLKRS
jgi:hypothetical protein